MSVLFGRRVFRHRGICSSSFRLFFEEKYNGEEFEKILKVLNDTDEDDLKRYIISNKRINELMRLRDEKGSFSDLDDLMPIMGIKVLEKFYGSMLDKKSMGLGKPMIPCLLQEQIASFSTVLSVNITGNRLAWSLLRRLKDNSLHVESLAVTTFELVPKSHFLSVLSQITELAQGLPSCELCVSEEFPPQVPSSYMFKFYLQMTQARSMLLGNLAAGKNSPQMLSIKTVAVAKLFNTYIGSERVSGQLLVDDMFDNSKGLEISSTLRKYYLDSEPQNKEHLCNVFLLNLAYWKLTHQFS